MNKLFFFILLLSSIVTGAQDNGVEDTVARPAITAKGKPAGEKIERKMDKDGGRISSADGKVELIVPAGALPKKTTISIQAVNNLAPNGNGQAYRLEPSGVQFAQPLQLIFHYDEEESADSMQLLMGIAMQDNTGQWYRLKKFELDTVAKTISGRISHFSDWSKFDKLKMYPTYARIKVGKQLSLTIDLIEHEEEELTGLNNNDEIAPLMPKKYKAVWTATAGTLKVHSSNDVTFTAPATVPAQNPVAISAKMQGVSFTYKGVSFNNMRLVSNILVYDNAYEVKMVSAIENGNAGSELGKANYKDTGSFVVSLETGKARIIERVNKNSSDALDYKGKCTIVLLNSGANSGLIHITGVRNIRVIPASSPTQRPSVEINFIQAMAKLSILRITCPPPPGSGGGPTTITTPAAPMPAMPITIKFEAKEEEQTIYEFGKEGSELYVKFTVKQIKDD